jgi:hypothetical protein
VADNFEGCLVLARAELGQAMALIKNDIRNYPTPISGCDAQFNHLLSERQRINAALHALEQPYFVPTPRTPAQNAGVESR